MKTFTPIFRLILLLTIGVRCFANSNNIVTHTNIFSGEVASNLTTGAPLSVSATGFVGTGITNVEKAFSSTITTTSTSAVVMTSLTTTPVPGTYLVVFSTWFTHSNGNDTVTYGVYVAGVVNAGSARTVVPFTGAVGAVNDGLEAGTNAIVTVNGSQAIAIEWLTNAGTASSHAATMDVVRLQ